MTEAINNLSQEVNNAVNESLAGVQDYVNITLQVTNISLYHLSFYCGGLLLILSLFTSQCYDVSNIATIS